MSLPPLFYIPDALIRTELSTEDARHAFKVLRIREGETVHVTDGNGHLWAYIVLVSGPKGVVLEQDRALMYDEVPFRIRLAVSPLKNPDRFEWLVEKAVELGVGSITPLLCARTESPRINRDRLERIMISALKQSRGLWLPVLDPLTPFTSLVKEPVGAGFIAWCSDQPLPHLNTVCTQISRLTLLIGPEGDFTPDEVQLALQHGYREVSLGKARLRTETAAIAGLHSVHLANL